MKYFLFIFLALIFFGCTQQNSIPSNLDSNPVSNSNLPASQQMSSSQIKQVCSQPDIEGAYACPDNSFKVVSGLIGGGFKVIHSDFTITSCYLIVMEGPPENRPADCIQFSKEGYCETQNLCN